MNPVKTYENASFKELMAYAAKNPHRKDALAPITRIAQASPLSRITPTLTSIHLPSHTSCTLNPTGPLSVFACILDPEYYQMIPQPVRSEQVSQLTTEWQGRIDELKNTSLARKKKTIYESIGAAFHQQPLESKNYLDLYKGLCALQHVHCILLKQAVHDDIMDAATATTRSASKGEVFFSSPPTTWDSVEESVWIADYYGNWVALPLSEQDPANNTSTRTIAEWIQALEEDGWTIQWPMTAAVDSRTKPELIAELKKEFPAVWDTIDPTKKWLKEDYATLLAKHQTLGGLQANL